MIEEDHWVVYSEIYATFDIGMTAIQTSLHLHLKAKNSLLSLDIISFNRRSKQGVENTFLISIQVMEPEFFPKNQQQSIQWIFQKDLPK